MSTRLRGDAAYVMCEYRLRSVPFLVDPTIEPVRHAHPTRIRGIPMHSTTQH